MAQLPKIQRFTSWLYAEDLKTETLLECVEFKPRETKKGTLIDCMWVLGKVGIKEGDFTISLFNFDKSIENIVGILGTDDSAYKGRLFSFSASKEIPGKISISLVKN